MKIPFVDLKRVMQGRLYSDIRLAVQTVINSNVFLNGPEVEAFEAEWAA